MEPLVYQIIRRPRLKYIYINVDHEGNVRIKAHPRVSEEEIERLVAKKSEWIRKKQHRFREFQSAKENRIFYLGELYEREKLSETFQIPLQTQTQIDLFYRMRARELILPMVEKWSEKSGLFPTAVSFRKNRTRWGSCSAKDRLSFNTQLARTPLPFIEYVVVHELSHIRHKDHSKAFWNLVALHLPDYKSRQNLGKNPHFLL